MKTKAEKAEYDRQYRAKNKERITEKKRKYNSSPAGREMQKRQRDKRKEKHNEYCRQPEYRAKKVLYDREHRAKKYFGENWESAILIEEINKLLTEKADKHQLRTIQGTNTKSIRRKRQWLRLLQNLRQLT